MLLALALAGGLGGCGAEEAIPLPDTYAAPLEGEGFELVARFAQITDAHVTDEESPGRLTALAGFNASTWRPHERFSIHLLDGMIRTMNAYHEQVGEIDFVIHTGDATDNVQANELGWFLDAFDGLTIDPLSGIDDREPADRGPAALDPHHPFRAEGLYRHGVHGDRPSIPWYAVRGNHDHYAVGVFPIIRRLDDRLVAPLPVGFRIGLFLPTALIPDGDVAYGPVSPAQPGPPPPINFPSRVVPNPQRRFLTEQEFIQAHFETLSEPAGHGFADERTTWYGTSPVPGLRLIVLDTSVPLVTIPTGVYAEGAVVTEQYRFLVDELDRAQSAGQIVLVASHHPSAELLPAMGTALSPERFRRLLNAYPNVVAHLAGHSHRNRVWNRGGYLEFETSAVIDFPQQGRIIEVWRSGDRVELRYAVFSHLYDGSALEGIDLPQARTDPFVPLRQQARALAEEHTSHY